TPVDIRRRPLQPHRVAVGQTEGGEEGGEGVADEGGVEVGEVTRAEHHGGRQHGGRHDTPPCRAYHFPRNGHSLSGEGVRGNALGALQVPSRYRSSPVPRDRRGAAPRRGTGGTIYRLAPRLR